MIDKTQPLTDSEEPSGSGAAARRAQPTSWMLMPRTELAGRFVVAEMLGSGGMGEVYAAQDRVLNERVAVKIVHPQGAVGSDAFSRFCREVKLARRVSHPNVCRVYDLYRHEASGENTLDLVSMELLRGRSLRQVLATEGCLPPGQALDLARQIANGLQAAHRVGILHRDLKPGNIMLVEEGSGLRAVITDFGLACVYDQSLEEPPLTGTGELLGTPAYISPEQIQGEELSAATDLYSLGILLFEMLSGERPFTGKNVVQMAVSRLVEAPRPLDELCPQLDPDQVDLVNRCLARDPADRFADCAEFLEALDSLGASDREASRPAAGQVLADGPRTESSPVEQTPTTAVSPNTPPTEPLVPPTAHSSNRGPWIAGGLLALLVVLGVVLLRPEEGQGPTSPTVGPDTAGSEWSEGPRLEDRVASFLDNQVQEMEGVPALAEAPSQSADPESVQRADTHLAVFDGMAALDVVDQALAQHPDEPYLLARRAMAQWRLGYDAEALETSRRAVALSGGLGAEKPLRIDPLYYGLKGDWRRASELLRRRVAAETASLEDGLALLEASWLSGTNDPMDDVFSTLRQLPGADQEGRLALWQARVVHSQGDYERQEQLARGLVDTANGLQQPFLAMEARLEQVEALGRLGRLQDAQRKVGELLALAQKADVPLYTAHALRAEGRLLKRQGRSAQAIERLRRALSLYQMLGSRWGACLTYKLLGYSSNANLLRNPTEALEATIEGDLQGLEVCGAGGFREKEALVKLNLGRAYRDRGALEEALGLFQESAETLDQLGNRRHQAMTRLNLALLLGRMGRIDETLAALEASETWQRQHSDRGELAKILVVRAWALISAGRLADAKSAIAAVQAVPGAEARRVDLLDLQGEVAWAEGDAEALRTVAQELESVATRLNRPEGTQIARRLAAQAMLLDGRVDAGLAALARVDTARAALTRAEILWDRGQGEAAASVLNASREAITALEERFKDWRLEILDASLSAQSGTDTATGTRRALERLRAVEHAAVRKGHLHAAVRARLAIGRLENDHAMLRAVEAECQRYGFLKLADHARELRGRT